MTVRPDFPLHAETLLPQLQFASMKMVLLHQAQEHDLPVIENSETRLTVETHHGCLSFAQADEGIRVTASATQQDWLFMLKEGLVEQLTHFVPDVAAALRWSDAEQSNGLPPNFHFVTVQSVKPVGAAFLRIRIKASGLSSFQDDAIHFRLVLPPAGLDEVEWPRVSENGSTLWPKGDKALHRPVYTTRWIDHQQGLMDFDVFLHDGGRVTEWANTVKPGAQVAVVGPGGGGIPDTDQILMFADETALPAAARILETLPEHTHGHVTLKVANGAYCAYPLTAPAGVSVTWLDSASGASLADIALKAHADFPTLFLWFACEKTEVQKVRATFKDRGGNPAQAYIAAYWTA